ncbi:MAG: monooxygenase family protein, partial [Propionicimonas sp.]
MERRTHAYDGSLAVFLIGLRIHKPWRLGLVRSAVAAMPRMIAELERNRAAAARGEEESMGFLGSRFTVDLTGVTSIQWWRSTQDIYEYANSGVREHRPAWVEFYRLAKADPDAVTIWHETYAV